MPQGIRRIAREQLEAAVESLKGRGSRDEAIHDARKRVKKARALLRLVRQELGNFYGAENTRLRDAGRGLSEFRDAAAVIATFDELREHYRDEMHKHPLDSIRRGLQLRKSRAERKANFKQALDEIAAVLSSSARRAGKWPLAADGFAAIAPGIERTFRRGRRAMQVAHGEARPENYHEWRKRVKDQWYHTRLLGDVWSEVMGGYERSLKQLEDWLGSDHNLEVLRAKIAAEPEFYGAPEDIELLMDLIAKREKELRDCSQTLGGRVYVESPGAYRKRLHRLWDVWQG